jgi:gas vesicle structural protein
MSQSVANEKQVTLLDLLDRAIYKGVVLNGDITISVANVDLVYLGLKLLLTSVDRIEEMRKLAAEQAIAGWPKGEL